MGNVKAIEITPEMIDAGVREYFSWDHREDDPRQIVAAILAAAIGAQSQA